MFNSLPVVREVQQIDLLAEGVRRYRFDTITLGWEDRLRARGRRRSDQGTDFGTALPRGTVLREGDCLVLDGLERVVRVVEREENVFVIAPDTPREWGLFAYFIGNSHQPVMITDGAIVCPDLPGMELILEQHRISFRRARQAFTPVGLGSELGSNHQHLLR